MSKDIDFIKRGWNFPVYFDQGGKTVWMVDDKEDIEQSLDILLTTELLERLMHPDFGCGLKQFLYEEITFDLIDRIKNLINNAILLYESRIEVRSIDISQDLNEQNILIIHINYQIKAISANSNTVYLFNMFTGIQRSDL